MEYLGIFPFLSQNAMKWTAWLPGVPLFHFLSIFCDWMALTELCPKKMPLLLGRWLFNSFLVVTSQDPGPDLDVYLEQRCVPKNRWGNWALEKGGHRASLVSGNSSHYTGCCGSLLTMSFPHLTTVCEASLLLPPLTTSPRCQPHYGLSLERHIGFFQSCFVPV